MTDPGIAPAQAVRMGRERRGWSARKTSHEAQLSPSYVDKLEAGKVASPSLRAFARLAEALQLTPQEIYLSVIYEAHAHGYGPQ